MVKDSLRGSQKGRTEERKRKIDGWNRGQQESALREEALEGRDTEEIKTMHEITFPNAL